MIEAVLFDVDGVILNGMCFWEHAGERYLKSVGITAEAEISEKLFTFSLREAAIYIKIRYHMNVNIQEIMDGITQLAKKFYKDEVRIIPKIKPALDFFKRKEIPLYIATSAESSCIKIAFDRLGLGDYFHEIYTCTEIGFGKHDKKFYEGILNDIKTRKEYTWIVEDSLYAIQTVKEMGMPIVGVYDSMSAEDQEKIKVLSNYYIGQEENYEKWIKEIK